MKQNSQATIEVDRNYHDDTLRAIGKPDYLLNSPLDDEYFISDGSQQIKRRPPIKIDFRVAILPGPELLTDKQHTCDLLTAKILILRAFLKPEGWTDSGQVVANLHRAHLTMVRWRLALGFSRNSMLTREAFKAFCETVQVDGVQALVPCEARAHDFIRSIDEGQADWPIAFTNSWVQIAWETVARKMGMSSEKSFTPQTFTILYRALERQRPDLYAKMVCSPLRAATFIKEISSGAAAWPEEPSTTRKGVAWRQVFHAMGFKRQPYVPVDTWTTLLDGLEQQKPELLDVAEFAKFASPEILSHPGYTVSRLMTLFEPWDRLAQLRARMVHDPIGFSPFDRLNKRATLASSIASLTLNTTPTPPAEQTCFLVDRALRWVLFYSEDIKNWHDLVVAAFTKYPPTSAENNKLRAALIEQYLSSSAPTTVLPDSPGAPTSVLPIYATQWHFERLTKETGLDLRTVIFKLLPAACVIVIAVFAARRADEIDSVMDDCVFYEDGVPWLLLWIDKTLRRFDQIPVPTSVAKAVDVLKWLSKRFREDHDSRWLFDMAEPWFNGGHIKFMARDAIRIFADFVGVPPLPDGSFWVFSPHQFRRFFSVIYYHRFRFSSLTALSYFLRHYDPDMTRRYVEERVAGVYSHLAEDVSPEDRKKLSRLAAQEARTRADEFQETGVAATVERLWRLVTGEESVGGGAAAHLLDDLEKMISKLSQRIQVLGEDADPSGSLSGLLEIYARNHVHEPNGQGHSYCLCSDRKEDLDIAACLAAKREFEGSDSTRSATGPDKAYASDTTCASCPKNLQAAENEGYWADEVQLATKAADNPSTPHQAEVSAGRLKSVSGIYQRSYAEALSIRNPYRRKSA